MGFSLGYKVFITAVNGQVSGLLSKYLAAATQHQAATSLSTTSTSGVTGVPTPHNGDLQRRKTEPALANRSRVVTQHNSFPVASISETNSSNGGVRRTARTSGEGTNKPGSIGTSNDADPDSSEGTDDTEVEYGKGDSGGGSCSSGATNSDKNKSYAGENGGLNSSNSSGIDNEDVPESQGCVLM